MLLVMRRFLTFVAAFLIWISLSCSSHAQEIGENKNASWVGPLVKRNQRAVLVQTEFGEISAVGVTDGVRGPYHLQFFTLEPNSLFLPVLLRADMVFFVHTGSGTLSWADEDHMRNVRISRGDIYTLPAGSLFYVQSNLEPERQKLRIYAIFSNTDSGIYDEPSVRPYSSISDLVLGFDRRVLRAAFQVPEEVLAEITSATRAPPIVHAVSEKKTGGTMLWELEARYLKAFLGANNKWINGKKKKKPKRKPVNIFYRDPDFNNCNGWSTTVNKEELSSLAESNTGVFMVNLTKGSMMGPHWNPSATEIAVVLYGQGMSRVVCSGNSSESHCRNMRFRVEEGDVFTVPRFHAMAQMSFNYDSFVFMGFSTSTRRNDPQFLAGKRSVLQVLDKYILAASFNVTNTTIDHLLAAQVDSIILDCTSCAEEEESIMEEEIRRRREEEEAKRREEEEARRREEEEARKREEEEARRREEEEARKREEEEARRCEEEEEARREEEARKREEEEARRREEEEARKREEEEEARKREEEEARRREEEEEARRREEEVRERKEEEARRREEEEARKREEEKEARRREEEERQRQEEEEREEERRREEKEEERRREEEAGTREQEEARKEEEERERRREEEEFEGRKGDRRRWLRALNKVARL